MSQWYLSFDGQQEGPFNLVQARERIRIKPNGFAWREGFVDCAYFSGRRIIRH